MTDIQKSVEDVRKPWIGSRYYEDAEKWTHIFWDAASPFRSYFERLSLRSVIELASGYGRHAEMAAPLCKKLVLVDVIQENLDFCRVRLEAFKNVSFLLGDGVSFPVRGSTADAIYCFDAMVHFPAEVVDLYLADTARVLRKGGLALYHHSNLGESGESKWAANPHARNYMTREKFAYLSSKHGLDVVEQRVIGWGGVPELDCISLIGKR